MSIDLNTKPATSITIQPPKQDAKPYEYTTGKKVAATEAEFLGHDGGFGFSDLLDIINPLQHIPIVSTIYRELTGDTISPGAKVLGGGLLGGITGIVGAVADSIFAQEHGKDTGQAVFAALTSGQQAKSEATLKTADAIVNDKQAALMNAGDDAGLAQLNETRKLIASVRDTNASLFNAAATTQLDTFGLPITTQETATAGAVKQASAKYREAQFLAQQQNMMLDATKDLGQTSKEKRDKERDDYFGGMFDNSQYRDWLSSIT